ncbi:MAG: response regulator [Chloroflexota bacterium]
MAKIRVLLVDDHPVLRLGVRDLLSAEPDLDVVGEAGDGATALCLARQLHPDVAVVDITMPGIDGLETTRNLVGMESGCRVIILTVHAQEDYLFHALQAGASGFLPKTTAYDRLVDAVRTVARGEVYLLPEAARLVVTGYLGRAAQPQNDGEAKLSEREREVLSRTAAGHTSREIAEELFISRNTVDTYRRRIMEKLGLRRRAELVRYALQRGLIPRRD